MTSLFLDLKNLRRIMVRDGICGESANGLKNGCRRWSVWVRVGQAGRSEKAFQTDTILFWGHRGRANVFFSKSFYIHILTRSLSPS